MLSSLFVFLNSLYCAYAYRTDGSSHYSRFQTSPHTFSEKVAQDFSIQCMSDTEYYTLTVLAIVPLSAIISFAITSQLYKKNLLAMIGAPFRKPAMPDTDEDTTTITSDTEEQPKETDEEKYIKSYPIKRAVHKPPKNLDELQYSIIIEGTPRGIVVMCYNSKMEGFEYWCDNDVPVPILETVARRYVTDYNCKKFYMPKKTELLEPVIATCAGSTGDTGCISPSYKLRVEHPVHLISVHSDLDGQDGEGTIPPNGLFEEKPTTATTSGSSSASSDQEDEDVFMRRKKTEKQLKLEQLIANQVPLTRFIKKGRLLDFKPKDLFKGMNFDEQLTKKTLDYKTFMNAMDQSIINTPSTTDYAKIRDECDKLPKNTLYKPDPNFDHCAGSSLP